MKLTKQLCLLTLLLCAATAQPMQYLKNHSKAGLTLSLVLGASYFAHRLEDGIDTRYVGVAQPWGIRYGRYLLTALAYPCRMIVAPFSYADGREKGREIALLKEEKLHLTDALQTMTANRDNLTGVENEKALLQDEGFRLRGELRTITGERDALQIQVATLNNKAGDLKNDAVRLQQEAASLAATLQKEKEEVVLLKSKVDLHGKSIQEMSQGYKRQENDLEFIIKNREALIKSKEELLKKNEALAANLEQQVQELKKAKGSAEALLKQEKSKFEERLQLIAPLALKNVLNEAIDPKTGFFKVWYKDPSKVDVAAVAPALEVLVLLCKWASNKDKEAYQLKGAATNALNAERPRLNEIWSALLQNKMVISKTKTGDLNEIATFYRFKKSKNMFY